MKLRKSELKEFLDEKADLYNRPSFIELDPISIPHRYTGKGDIEIAGFLAATIAWGNRKMILKSSVRIMEILEDSPFEFIVKSIERLKSHEVISFGTTAIVVTIISIIIKELMAQYSFYAAKKTNLKSIKADGWHHRSDALSSIIILAGIFLNKYF